jgi:hypothetical protein
VNFFISFSLKVLIIFGIGLIDKSDNGQQCVQILRSRGVSFNEDGTMVMDQLTMTSGANGVLV